MQSIVQTLALVSIMCSTVCSLRADYRHENVAVVSIMCSTVCSLRADYRHENVAVVSIMCSIVCSTIGCCMEIMLKEPIVFHIWFVSKSTSFVLSLFQCTVFKVVKVNIIIVMS